MAVDAISRRYYSWKFLGALGDFVGSIPHHYPTEIRMNPVAEWHHFKPRAPTIKVGFRVGDEL